MSPLGNATTVLDHIFETVSLDDDYLPVMVRQNAGSGETSHAAAHDDGSISLTLIVCGRDRTHIAFPSEVRVGRTEVFCSLLYAQSVAAFDHRSAIFPVSLRRSWLAERERLLDQRTPLWTHGVALTVSRSPKLLACEDSVLSFADRTQNALRSLKKRG